MPRPLSGGQFQIPSLFRCKLRQSNCSHWTTFHFHFVYYMFLYLNCKTTHTTLQCTQFKHNLLYDVLQMQSICNFLQCRAFLTRISGDISRPSGSSFWFKYICNLSGIFILITRTVILASVLYMIVLVYLHWYGRVLLALGLVSTFVTLKTLLTQLAYPTTTPLLPVLLQTCPFSKYHSSIKKNIQN